MVHALIVLQEMKTRKFVSLIAVLLVLSILGIIGISVGDYFLTVKHWKSREGCKEITKIDLPSSTTILDYKVSAYYSIADRPNHRWLLESKDGFEGMKKRVSEFTLGGAEYTKYLRDDWPELDDQYGSKEIGETIMGIGTGEETLFISADGKFAILYAFRS